MLSELQQENVKLAYNVKYLEQQLNDSEHEVSSLASGCRDGCEIHKEGGYEKACLSAAFRELRMQRYEQNVEVRSQLDGNEDEDGHMMEKKKCTATQVQRHALHDVDINIRNVSEISRNVSSELRTAPHR